MFKLEKKCLGIYKKTKHFFALFYNYWITLFNFNVDVKLIVPSYSSLNFINIIPLNWVETFDDSFSVNSPYDKLNLTILLSFLTKIPDDLTVTIFSSSLIERWLSNWLILFNFLDFFKLSSCFSQPASVFSYKPAIFPKSFLRIKAKTFILSLFKKRRFF